MRGVRSAEDHVDAATAGLAGRLLPDDGCATELPAAAILAAHATTDDHAADASLVLPTAVRPGHACTAVFIPEGTRLRATLHRGRGDRARYGGVGPRGRRGRACGA